MLLLVITSNCTSKVRAQHRAKTKATGATTPSAKSAHHRRPEAPAGCAARSFAPLPVRTVALVQAQTVTGGRVRAR